MKYEQARYQENPEKNENSEMQKEYQKRRYQDKKKRCDNSDNFFQQVKQGPQYICTIAVEASIKAVLNCLSMKNITFSLQSCITK